MNAFRFQAAAAHLVRKEIFALFNHTIELYKEVQDISLNMIIMKNGDRYKITLIKQ